MTPNPIIVALKAKGPFNLYLRSRSIAQRYGLSPMLMDQALKMFSSILLHFNCGATFPITAVTLKRHANTIAKYLDRNIEFAVHGYTHVDYARLVPEIQLAHLRQAREAFAQVGIKATGFRSPYLRRETHLYEAIEAAGFTYVSNQPFLWDVLDSDVIPTTRFPGYERALAFYDPWRASERQSLPRPERQLVEIPVSLPDDEILIERLGGSSSLIDQTWQCILAQSYQRGELFTLQLHPERAMLAADSLSNVLANARALSPAVWIARLDEIAAWWNARATATLTATEIGEGRYYCVVTGPDAITVLTRALDVDQPALPWADGYQRVTSKSFSFHAPNKPFIGLSPSSPKDLFRFLQLQGYIVEINQEREGYLVYFDQENFNTSRGRLVLDQIEASGGSLIRLGFWPNGARSALSITGDIDALTLWDYGLRVIGK